MPSKGYQIWITYDNDKEKVQLPVLPEEYTINIGDKDKTVDVIGLGELIMIEGRPAAVVSFESFFPATAFPGVKTRELWKPYKYYSTLRRFKAGLQPKHLIIAGGAHVNMHVTLSTLNRTDKGGDVDTIYYSLTMKEYRFAAPLTKYTGQAGGQANKAAKGGDGEEAGARPDTRVVPETHTVAPGDCLYKIAQKYYGDPARLDDIYELNRDKIKNKSLIVDGWVLKLPPK